MTSHADVVAPRISPTRTLAISIALVLHAGAFALLVAPVRAPDRDAEVMPPKIEVAMLERVIPPPPPAPGRADHPATADTGAGATRGAAGRPPEPGTRADSGRCRARDRAAE
jgi:hypothetical protein